MRGLIGCLVVALALASPALAQRAPEPVQPPPHTAPWPALGTGATDGLVQASLALGPELQRGQSARAMLADRRKLDAYVVSVALDSDLVFSREAREAGKVLARRYGAAGRAITLAGPDGRQADLPKGSLSALTLVLARVAELMDPAEDVLVLYTTSHGAPEGIAYHDGDTGYGLLSPYRLGSVLSELGIKRRVVLLSACYSGVFAPYLASPDTALVTAAAADKSSFGCMAENDWTFFGDALVNRALRKPASLEAGAAEARQSIAQWEAGNGLQPSEPQVVLGTGVGAWLPALEARIPREATQPVGEPSVNSLARLRGMVTSVGAGR